MLAPLSNCLGSMARFAFGSAFGRVVVIPLLFAAAYFLVALFIYYRGSYDPLRLRPSSLKKSRRPFRHTPSLPSSLRSGLDCW